MKNDRQNQLLQIISEEIIETQEQLLERLQAKGIKSTQATISRDIKELRLVKVQSSDGRYIYAKPTQDRQTGDMEGFRSIFTQSLLHIENCYVFFITSINGNLILLQRLKNLKNERDFFDEDLLEDAEIELRQAQESTNIYSGILSGMMDAYASVISNNVNDIMKQLTSVSIVLMIPTMIASFYGMNVPNPLQYSQWGLTGIIAISILLSIVGIWLLRKRKWF